MAGTKKLEAYDLPSRRAPIITPRAEVAPATLAAARSSIVPPEGSLESPESSESPTSPRSADREPGVEQLRTRLARKFTTLADEVTECFEDFHIGAGAWGAELTAPEGMSTNGGKHATQHLRLRATRQGFPVLVGGSVDPVAKTAELRDHDYMLAAHEARYGTVLEISFDEWEQFLRKCEVVLRLANIEPRRASVRADLARQVAKPGVITARTVALATLAFIVPLVLLVGWRVLAVLLR